MSEHEARQMAALLARETAARGAHVDAAQNDMGGWVVRVTWSTGPVFYVSVRQCIRAAKWHRERGGAA